MGNPLFTLLLLLALFTGCSGLGIAEQTIPKNAPLFFVVHAKYGEWQPGVNYSEHGTLRLEGVERSVLYYTVESGSSTGRLEMEKFINIWDSATENQKGDPIHAGLIHFDPVNEQSVNLELLLYDPKYDVEEKNLSFNGEILGEVPEILRMYNVNLYIDDSSRYVLSNTN